MLFMTLIITQPWKSNLSYTLDDTHTAQEFRGGMAKNRYKTKHFRLLKDNLYFLYEANVPVPMIYSVR